MQKYNHSKIEKKWQKQWLESKVFEAKDSSKKPKKFVLVEFPYPSGAGLHMGHLRPYVAADVYSRYFRMKGYEVLFPIGWDAFGLPAENYALKMGVHPSKTTAQNIKNAKKQLHSWGISFDWSREINTTDPQYYKWTQWIFEKFYEKGLAYEATGMINWCPKDKTGLANEEVIDGKCERCGTPVEKKELRQWYLKITAYAEKLLEGLKNLPQWPDPVKQQQANWIGRKEGINITYSIENSNQTVTVFTTRPDTNFGATFVVLGPEHPMLQDRNILNIDEKVWREIEKYKQKAASEADMERTAENRKKTGVFTGLYAVNNLNNYRMPLYVSDYVLGNVGTGAVVGVPGHDKRDFEFAQVFNLPVVRVVQKDSNDIGAIDHIDKVQEEEGTMVNSEFLNGLDIHQATIKIMDVLEDKGWGKRVVTYKLRDWVFSRQRYWGEPIPIVHCEDDGIVAVPEKDLPVKLPNVKKYEPTGTGESPLAGITKWVETKCPKCGKLAYRETNTMPQWAGSSWYWLRYTDPNNKKSFAGKEKQEFWTPVDVYFGGMEHTTLHLLYSRFWNLFLYDQDLVTQKEPYKKRVPHGIVLGPDGEKMSKSRGNVVNPDEVVKSHGADSLRMFELFLGPHEATVAWNSQGIVGVKRFLDRVWEGVGRRIGESEKSDSQKAKQSLHKLIKKVTEDIENFRFNTAISAFMEFFNGIKDEPVSLKTVKTFLVLLYPFAPHFSEELGQLVSSSANELIGKSGEQKTLQTEKWPEYDEAMLMEQTVDIVVQINGKVKTRLTVNRDIKEEEVKQKVLDLEPIKKALAGDSIKRVVFVPNKLVNLVI